MSTGNVIATAGSSTEPAEEVVFAKSTSLGFGPTYSLDNAVTWNDLIAEYEYLIFNYEVDITGVSDDVLRTITIKTADIRDDTRWRLEYGTGVVDFQPGVLTGGDWTFTGATTDEIALEIRGRRAQTVVIPTSETVVDDQSASGYMDIGTMRMQWGVWTSTGDAAQTQSFGQPFGAAPYFISVQKDNQGANEGENNITVDMTTVTSTGVDVNPQDVSNAPGDPWLYFAIGPKP